MSTSEQYLHPAHPPEPTLQASLDDLANIMRLQAALMERVLSETQQQAFHNSGLSQEILNTLRGIHDKQINVDLSKQPIPAVTATSSSAWGPLLRSHLNHIQPTVDRWRGTLDTLLVFVALFSAIVAAFFVQSLTGLTQDAGSRTNELLQNVTDVLIAISGANASQLNLSQPTLFQPDGSAVRLNFYWSISLILSISVAALAVTSRGYVGMLSRSSHNRAYKKLGDLHRRWDHANRLLAPAIEVLPQLLIMPVVLFVVGLLDNLISTTIPLSEPFTPIFAAGVASSAFAITVAAYTTWTVAHGCWYSDVSPFQSTLSRLGAVHGRNALMSLGDTFHALQRYIMIVLAMLYALCTGTAVSKRWQPPVIPRGQTASDEWDDTDIDTSKTGPILESYEHEAFHATLQRTHEDDILDQAMAAIPSLIAQRHALEATEHSPLKSLDFEVRSLSYMLSDEASLRSNVTAAEFIANSIHSSQSYGYDRRQRCHLISLLMRSSERYSVTTTGQRTSSVLWNCPFTVAMHKLICSDPMSDSPENYQDSMLARHMPVVGMLLADTTALDEVVSYSDISPLRRILISFLARILYSQLQKYGGASGANMTSAMNLLMVSDPDDITPSLLEALRRPLPDIYAYVSSPKRISYVMTLGLAQGLVATELHALQMFVHYFIYWSISLGGVLLRDVAGGGDLTIDIFTTELIKDSSGVTVRGNGFEWLAFVLNEIYFLISYDEYGSVTRTPESLSTALDFVVKTVLFLLEYDHDHDVARHRLDIVDYQHDRKKCSSLCRFSTAIIDILYLIREHYPRTAFMLTAVWHDLASRLDILSAELGHHYSPGGRHRDRVKQNIRVAFRCFTPENPHVNIYGQTPQDETWRTNFRTTGTFPAHSPGASRIRPWPPLRPPLNSHAETRPHVFQPNYVSSLPPTPYWSASGLPRPANDEPVFPGPLPNNEAPLDQLPYIPSPPINEEGRAELYPDVQQSHLADPSDGARPSSVLNTNVQPIPRPYVLSTTMYYPDRQDVVEPGAEVVPTSWPQPESHSQHIINPMQGIPSEVAPLPLHPLPEWHRASEPLPQSAQSPESETVSPVIPSLDPQVRSDSEWIYPPPSLAYPIQLSSQSAPPDLNSDRHTRGHLTHIPWLSSALPMPSDDRDESAPRPSSARYASENATQPATVAAVNFQRTSSSNTPMNGRIVRTASA